MADFALSPTALARAETCYRQCLERNPNHRDCHRGLAVLLIEENRTTEAFTSIQTWATQSPSLAEPRMELARLYEEFGNKEAATNTLADAVRLNPNDARQWAALGKVREETGNYSAGLGQLPAFAGDQPRTGGRGGPGHRIAATMAQPPLALPPPPGTASPVVAGQSARRAVRCFVSTEFIPFTLKNRTNSVPGRRFFPFVPIMPNILSMPMATAADAQR